MTREIEPIVLRIAMTPQPGGAWLRWESDVIGVRTSKLSGPLSRADRRLVLRALDVLQDPAYPRAWTVEQRRHFGFSDQEQAALSELGLWDQRGRIARDAARRIGRLLYRALTSDPNGAQALGTLRDHSAALGRPLAIEVCVPAGAYELAALPWELLWDEGPTPLLMRETPIWLVRRLDIAQALPPPRRRSGPLRVLAVSPQAGIGPELRQIERTARMAAWKPLIESGKAELEEIEPVDRAVLLRAVMQASPPDIVHFYGHGRMLEGEAALLLDDRRGGSWTNAAALAATLSGVGVVLLHACQGAAIAPLDLPDTGDPLLGGVAQALCAAGAPAVLGMQFTIRSDAATRFAAALYRDLARGRSLEAALAGARRVLFVEEPDQISWFGPALYLRSRSGGPTYLRPPAHGPLFSGTGAQQSIIARGAVVQHAEMIGGVGSRQRIVAEQGALVRHVRLHDDPGPAGEPQD